MAIDTNWTRAGHCKGKLLGDNESELEDDGGNKLQVIYMNIYIIVINVRDVIK